jgi:hypothetical protein
MLTLLGPVPIDFVALVVREVLGCGAFGAVALVVREVLGAGALAAFIAFFKRSAPYIRFTPCTNSAFLDVAAFLRDADIPMPLILSIVACFTGV